MIGRRLSHAPAKATFSLLGNGSECLSTTSWLPAQQDAGFRRTFFTYFWAPIFSSRNPNSMEHKKAITK